MPSPAFRPSPFGLYQPWNLIRTLKTTAAQPPQTQMFLLVFRLNIQEGGTKKQIQQEYAGFDGVSFNPRLLWVSNCASILLYTPTDDFIRLNCLTQTSYLLITWKQLDAFRHVDTDKKTCWEIRNINSMIFNLLIPKIYILIFYLHSIYGWQHFKYCAVGQKKKYIFFVKIIKGEKIIWTIFY